MGYVAYQGGVNKGKEPIDLMVGREGFEPSTIGLKVRDLRPI